MMRLCEVWKLPEKMATRLALPAIFCVSLFCVNAQGATITHWNFNDAPVTGNFTNNNPDPVIGAGFATPVGMANDANNADIESTNNPGSPNDPAQATHPDPPNRRWRVRGNQGTGNNGWSGTTQLLSGARFNVSTVGYENIVVGMDVNGSGGGPRHAQFQYTLDGSTFTSFGSIIDFFPTSDSWAFLSFDLSSIDGANDNPNFGVKLVSAFSPEEFTNNDGVQAANTAFQRADAGSGVYTGGAGNWRFDMVTFSGTAMDTGVVPEPSSIVLAGLALLGFVGYGVRRRRQAG